MSAMRLYENSTVEEERTERVGVKVLFTRRSMAMHGLQDTISRPPVQAEKSAISPPPKLGVVQFARTCGGISLISRMYVLNMTRPAAPCTTSRFSSNAEKRWYCLAA